MKILQNYGNKNFAATLLLHNLPSATHPTLPSDRRFFNAARQCYFEMKTNKEPYFSILSSKILWCFVSCHREGATLNKDILHLLMMKWNGHFINDIDVCDALKVFIPHTFHPSILSLPLSHMYVRVYCIERSFKPCMYVVLTPSPPPPPSSPNPEMNE